MPGKESVLILVLNRPTLWVHFTMPGLITVSLEKYNIYTESVVLRVIAVGEKDDVLDIVEDLGKEFDLDLPEDM